ncbi:ATP-binding protein [Sphingomonas sp.]|uniref:ATP-binding protein n=1 Tax=Sphingomonas sp. TaxID=28214 RepID=UPI003D6D8B40
MRRFVRPSIGVAGRVVAILLLAMVIEFGASTLLYERASQFAVREDEAHRLAEHLVICKRLIAAAPPEERAALATELSTDRYALRWRAQLPPPPANAPALDTMRRQVIGWEPALAKSNLRLRLVAPGHHAMVAGGLVLPDGDWLYFRTLQPVARLSSSFDRILLALIPAVVLMVLGSALLRRMLAPLHGLAEAADRFDGAGDHIVAEAGPSEVRRVTVAFNRMQARIRHLITDRTQALAAVGHDLRTPLARLSLRADMIDDREIGDAVAGDVAEMEAMVASLLAFLGGEDEPERPVATDLAVLCTTIVDTGSDAGRIIAYRGPEHLDLVTRPLALRRAIGNLVDNALRYGTRVDVVLQRGGNIVTIDIEDDGPGIPEASLARVLEPFVRLDDARTRDTVGFGLGLAIVTRTVDMLGGRFSLKNRPSGGLCARIALPISVERRHQPAPPGGQSQITASLSG